MRIRLGFLVGVGASSAGRVGAAEVLTVAAAGGVVPRVESDGTAGGAGTVSELFACVEGAVLVVDASTGVSLPLDGCDSSGFSVSASELDDVSGGLELGPPDSSDPPSLGISGLLLLGVVVSEALVDASDELSTPGTSGVSLSPSSGLITSECLSGSFVFSFILLILMAFSCPCKAGTSCDEQV